MSNTNNAPEYCQQLAPVARELLNQALDNGGCTVDAMGNPVTNGYAVGFGGAEALDPKRSYFDQVAEVVQAGLDKVGSPYPMAFGSWMDKSTGRIFVEPVQIIQDPETARALGTYRNEIAIFDLTRGVEINLTNTAQ